MATTFEYIDYKERFEKAFLTMESQQLTIASQQLTIRSLQIEMLLLKKCSLAAGMKSLLHLQHLTHLRFLMSLPSQQ